MKSRLETLLHQREVLREHTQWLEAEIAAERARIGTAMGSLATPLATLTTPPASDLPPIPLAEPDIKGLHSEVRQGCLLYFLVAALLLGGLIGFIYWKY